MLVLISESALASDGDKCIFIFISRSGILINTSAALYLKHIHSGFGAPGIQFR